MRFTDLQTAFKNMGDDVKGLKEQWQRSGASGLVGQRNANAGREGFITTPGIGFMGSALTTPQPPRVPVGGAEPFVKERFPSQAPLQKKTVEPFPSNAPLHKNTVEPFPSNAPLHKKTVEPFPSNAPLAKAAPRASQHTTVEHFPNHAKLWTNMQKVRETYLDPYISKRAGRIQRIDGFEGFEDPGVPGNLQKGGLLIENAAPGAIVEAVDPKNTSLRYGVGAHEAGHLRMYIPEADGSASINLSVMKNGDRAFDDVVSLKRQPDATDGGWSLALNNVNEVWMNGKEVKVQEVVNRLQFQTHVDKVMQITGTPLDNHPPFVSLNPETRSVGISSETPKGRLTLGTGGGIDAGGDMVFEVGNTHDRQKPGFTAINFNGYYDLGDQVFDENRARWRVGVDKDDTFFVDAWKRGWGSVRPVLSAPANEDALDVNGTLRLSNKYTGWAEVAPDRSEIASYVSDANSRKLVIMAPKKGDGNERLVEIRGGMTVDERVITPRINVVNPAAASAGVVGGVGGSANTRGTSISMEGGRLMVAPPQGSDFIIGSGTENRMILKGDGRVGVGVAEPASAFHVGGAVQIGGFVLSPEGERLVVRKADNGALLNSLGSVPTA